MGSFSSFFFFFQSISFSPWPPCHHTNQPTIEHVSSCYSLCRALEERMRNSAPTATAPPSVASTSSPEGHSMTSSHSSHVTCRVQVRLPGGHVFRRCFPSSAVLDDVISAVASSEYVSLPNVTLIQVSQPASTQCGVVPVCVPLELLSTYFNLPQPSVLLVQCVSP